MCMCMRARLTNTHSYATATLTALLVLILGCLGLSSVMVGAREPHHTNQHRPVSPNPKLSVYRSMW